MFYFFAAIYENIFYIFSAAWYTYDDWNTKRTVNK